MRNIIRIFFLSTTLLLFSCARESAFHRKLAEIDSLQTKDLVDSAYNEMRKLNTPNKISDEDNAYYCLVKTIISFRKEIILRNDSLINTCINYYEKKDNANKLTYAFYYKGRITYLRGNQKDATLYLKKAEDYSNETNDNLIKSKIYGNLGILNYNAGDYETALRYFKKAVSFSEKATDKEIILYNYANVGNTYGILGNLDSARHYIDKCIPIIKSSYDKNGKAGTYANIAAAYEDLDDNKAKYYAKLSIQIMPLDNVWGILGNIYQKEGKLIEAEKCWGEALKLCESYKRKIRILEDIAALRRKEKRYKEVDEISQRINLLKDSVAIQQKQDSIKDTQVSFDNDVKVDVVKEQASWLKTALLWTVCVALVASVVYVARIRRAHRNIRQMKGREADYEKSISSNNKKIDTLKQKNKAKSEEVAKVRRQMKSMEKSQQDTERELRVRLGHQLWQSLNKDGNTIKWEKDEFKCLFEYYRTINEPFMESLDHDYIKLTDTQRLYLILRNAGLDDEYIKKVMCMQSSSLRSLKSRTNKAAN